MFSSAAAKEIGDVVVGHNSRTPSDRSRAGEVLVGVPPQITTDYPTTLPLATVPGRCCEAADAAGHA